MPSLPAFTRNRALIALAISLVLGFSVGAGLNVVAGSRLALPDDAALPTFDDAPVEPSEGAVAAREDGATERSSSPAAASGGRIDRRILQEAVVRRNIFDSAAVLSEATADPANQDCKDTRSQLLATVVADVPEYSSALISDGGKGRANGYRIGDEVGSDGRILSIGPKKVCMDGGGCICMGTDSKKQAEPGAKDGDPAAADDGGVTKVSDTKFLVDRSFLEKQLGNVEALATQIRAAPKTEDGKVIGFRLSGIRKGSVFDKLGIKNGDVVHTVNGQSLTSMENAMGAYGSLQSERAFNFEITRRNQKMTIDYEVR